MIQTYLHRTIQVLTLAAVTTILVSAQTPQPQGRYVNPLQIEDMRSMADPTVLRFQGKYYLYLTGGAVWVSNDLVTWKHQQIQMPAGQHTPTAPNAFEYKGSVYISGNNSGFWKASNPVGPYTYAGDIKDPSGKVMKMFDPMTYVDTDGRVYMYYSGMHTNGIRGVELDPKDVTRFLTAPKHLFTFNPDHRWERYGDNNEGTHVSWLEAPWMTRHNGKYYLQYSAPGTEWKTYSVGVYTSAHPLGPFVVQPRNPMLVHHNGLIAGTGHHTTFEGPGGNLWTIYTVLFRNWSTFDRRIGMDPVFFDAKGNIYADGPSEEPRRVLAPNDPNASIALSINRYTYSASSAAPGRDPQYGFDDNVRTWWQPAEGDKQPWLTLDLGSRNDNDPNQEFMMDSSRVIFEAAPIRPSGEIHVDGHDRLHQFENQPGPLGVYKYKVEASLDGKNFTTVVDRTANKQVSTIEFDEFKPLRCRYVRLTVTEAPPGAPLAVLEFTAFGKSAE
ncbi:MAG TPA: family 43 glycosylhydrolase [Acidobacteriaceae bacterium]